MGLALTALHEIADEVRCDHRWSYHVGGQDWQEVERRSSACHPCSVVDFCISLAEREEAD